MSTSHLILHSALESAAVVDAVGRFGAQAASLRFAFKNGKCITLFVQEAPAVQRFNTASVSNSIMFLVAFSKSSFPSWRHHSYMIPLKENRIASAIS